MRRLDRWTWMIVGAACAACDADKVDATIADGGGDATIADATLDGAPHDAGGDAVSGDSADVADLGDVAPTPDASCATLYVSPTGSASASGCSTTQPKASIADAIAAAHANATVTTIEVCKGTFVETNLTLDLPVNLLGGFDCKTWLRTATYGAPTFDGTNETIVQHAGSFAATLSVTTATTSAKVTIDGLTVQGLGDASVVQGAAIKVTVGAPTISNDRILGGNTKAGSIGLAIDLQAAPLVEDDFIDGGTGQLATSTGVASAGVYLFGGAGAVTIKDSQINGGRGVATSSTPASVGVAVHPATPVVITLDGNTIDGGSGSTGGATGQGSVGVYADGPGSLYMESNFVDGGTGTGGSQGPTGIETFVVGDVTLLRNQVFGGVCAVTAPSNIASTGVLVSAPATVTSPPSRAVIVTNNMIHGGNSAAVTTGANTNALTIARSTNVTIYNNTLVAGVAGGTNPDRGAAIHENTSTALDIENNILVGGGGADLGIVFDECPWGGSLATFENNALLNFDSGVARYTPGVKAPCAGSGANFAGFTEWLATQPEAGSTALVTGNVLLKSSCTGETQCLAVAACTLPMSTSTCQHQIFATWNDADGGATEARGAGYLLTTTTPCSVARSSLKIATVVSDRFGASRPAMPSMGADQYDGTCE